MLGAPPIHRGTKMNKDCIYFFTFINSRFYFNTIHLKCYTKDDRPTKTTMLLIAWSSLAQLHLHIHQLPDCKTCSLIDYHCVQKTWSPLGAQGGGGGGCFGNHDIHVFRDPYISSTGESLTAAIVHTASLCIKQCPLKEQVIRYVGI